MFPNIGKKPIRDLNAAALLKVLQAIEGRGTNEIARRVRQMLGQIFRYAISRAASQLTPQPISQERRHPPTLFTIRPSPNRKRSADSRAQSKITKVNR